MSFADAIVASFEPLASTSDFASRQGQLVIEYLKFKKAETCVIEPTYIDKDYLIDYQTFYSRSFKDVERTTKRIHFFSAKFGQGDFKALLERGNLKRDEVASLGYLGFVVVKPVHDMHDKPLIGRTILEAPSVTDKNQHFVRKRHGVSLFGLGIATEGIPFQVQDQAVGACATVALWTAIHPLADLMGLQSYSQAEITSKISFFPSEQRVFPASAGLDLMQMLTFLRSSNANLDVEVIDIAYESTDELFQTAVKAYINLGLPLIATLELRSNKTPYDFHASVIVGYESDSDGKILKLHIHDDQIAPYSIATPGDDGNFKTLNTRWAELGYTQVIVKKLLVPVYNKIRVDFVRASTFHRSYLKRARESEPGTRADLLLFTVQAYKAELMNQKIEDKFSTLTKPMPHFLWVIRSYTAKNEVVVDEVLDATSYSANLSSQSPGIPNPNLVTTVTYL